jgi:hypothetical protein
MLAEIVAEPADTAVTTPAELTEATLAELDDQVTMDVTSSEVEG